MLLWIDGFEAYGTGTTGTAQSPAGIMARRGYTATTAKIATGRYGGYCAKVTSSAEAIITPALTTDTTLVVGCAVYLDFLSDGATPTGILYLSKDATNGINIRSNAHGQVLVYLANTLLATSASAPLRAKQWFYAELKVVCGLNGTYEVRINGVNVLSSADADTRPSGQTYNNKVQLPYHNAVAHYFDDLYIADGTAGVNDFLGNMRVSMLSADGDTGQNDWTRNAGTSSHYTYVDDGNLCNDDTDYVYSDTAAQYDLFDYAAASGYSSVIAVQMNLDCRNEDATDHSPIQVAKGTATSNGSATAIGTTSYTTQRRVMETDADSAAWNQTNLNATQFGFKL